MGTSARGRSRPQKPTGNLDFRTGEMIFELLGRLQRLHELLDANFPVGWDRAVIAAV
jgi:predicted ABC-type transport system involved in lysophospholipase L1 biosynthesis ATPase subunit